MVCKEDWFRVEKITKKCDLCGKLFEANWSTYRYCSDECRKKADKISQRKAYEKAKIKARKNPKTVLCRFCHNPVVPYFAGDRMCRKHYHEECLIEKGIEAIKRGEKIKNSEILRIVSNKGISKAELLEIMRERGEI